jgi:hypothetical protein
VQKSLTGKAAVSCFCGIDGAMVHTNPDDQTVRLLLSIQNRMQSTTGSGGVTPWIGQGFEKTSLVGNGLDDGQQIDCGTSQ